MRSKAIIRTATPILGETGQHPKRTSLGPVENETPSHSGEHPQRVPPLGEAAATVKATMRTPLVAVVHSGVIRKQRVQAWSSTEEKALRLLVSHHRSGKEILWRKGVFPAWLKLHDSFPVTYARRTQKSLSEKWVRLSLKAGADLLETLDVPGLSTDLSDVSGEGRDLLECTAPVGAGSYAPTADEASEEGEEGVSEPQTAQICPSLSGSLNPAPSEATCSRKRPYRRVRDIVPVAKRRSQEAQHGPVAKRPTSDPTPPQDTGQFVAESEWVSSMEVSDLVQFAKPHLASALGWSVDDMELGGVATVSVGLKREFNREIHRCLKMPVEHLHKRGRVPTPKNFDHDKMAQLEFLITSRVDHAIAKGLDWFLVLNAAVFSAAKVLSRREKHVGFTDRLQRNDRLTVKEYQQQEGLALRKLNRLRRHKGTSRLIRETTVKAERFRQMADLVSARIAGREKREGEVKARRRYGLSHSLRSILEPSASPQQVKPNEGKTIKFWRSLWSKQGRANTQHWRLREFGRFIETNRKHENPVITARDVIQMLGGALRRVSGSKAPGPDGIRAAWWRTFKRVVPYVSAWVVRVIFGVESTASWLCIGSTVLLPKGGDGTDPSNYRPITCLNTCYKLLTAVMTQLVNRHVAAVGGLPSQQVALQKGVWGTAVALLTDALAVCDATVARKPLGVCWFDFKKAFDSVPHNLIRWILRVIGLPDGFRSVIVSFMDMWTTRLRMGGKVIGGLIPVNTGVFQGDTLSPLLFCLSIWPISFALDQIPQYTFHCTRRQRVGFGVGHVAYMDDLKCYNGDRAVLTKAIHIVQECSSALGLAISYTKKSAWLDTSDNEETILNIPRLKGTYKYLGMLESLGLDGKASLDSIREKFMTKLHQVWSSKLLFGQCIHATKTICVPIVQYVLLNLFCNKKELQTVRHELRTWDSQIRGLLDECGVRSKSRNRSELYISRKEGGWGFPSLEDVFEDELCNKLSLLLARTETEQLFTICKCLEGRKAFTPLSAGISLLQDWGIEAELRGRKLFMGDEGVEPARIKRTLLEALSRAREQARLEKWMEPKYEQAGHKRGMVAGTWRKVEAIDIKLSNLYLVKGLIAKSVVSSNLATRGNAAILRNTGQGYVIGSNLYCRGCGCAGENRRHIASNCEYHRQETRLASARHDLVCMPILLALCESLGVDQPVNRKYPCNAVLQSDSVTIWVDFPFPNCRVKHNRPDLVVLFDWGGVRRLHIIEVAVSDVAQLRKQFRRKLCRYGVNSSEPYQEGIQPAYRNDCLAAQLRDRFGALRLEVVPVIIGSTGEIQDGELVRLRKGFPMLNAGQVLELLLKVQRNAILGTHRMISTHLALPEPDE